MQPAVRSIVPVVRPIAGAQIQRDETADRVPLSVATDVALEFVRFCYRRRSVAWPSLYDEMCAVASRGLFRGMGYAELAEHGVSFCLSELPVLVELTERVVAEESASEPGPSATLRVVPA